jgi:geranylgeranyl diphosphate synthase type II
MIDARLAELYEQHRTLNRFQGNPETLYAAMQYIMDLGGKRIRPQLVLMAAESAGAQAEMALELAHAVEVFHNFSLVHDDIMDQADRRRGQATVHKNWDEPTAILAGDNMLVAAYDAVFRYRGPQQAEALALFSKTAREVCEGQQKDMDFAQMNGVSIADYLRMIEQKTAVLLGCALQLGAMSANASSEVAQGFYRAGCALGLSFQMIDDYLDSFGQEAATGKRLGGDIAEGKKTWLYLSSQAISSDVETLFEQYQEDERIDRVRALWIQQGLDKGLLELAEHYHQLANQEWKSLQIAGCDTQALESLSDWLLGRTH